MSMLTKARLGRIQALESAGFEPRGRLQRPVPSVFATSKSASFSSGRSNSQAGNGGRTPSVILSFPSRTFLSDQFGLAMASPSDAHEPFGPSYLLDQLIADADPRELFGEAA